MQSGAKNRVISKPLGGGVNKGAAEGRYGDRRHVTTGNTRQNDDKIVKGKTRIQFGQGDRTEKLRSAFTSEKTQDSIRKTGCNARSNEGVIQVIGRGGGTTGLSGD